MDSLTSKPYWLTLNGPGGNIITAVTDDVASRIVRLLPDGDSGLHLHSALGSDLSGLIDRVNARTHAQRVTAAAVMLHRQGVDSFDRARLRDAFTSADVTLPGNLARDVTAAVSAGWLRPDPEQPGSFSLTPAGLTAVNGRFNRGVRGVSNSSRRATGSGRDMSGDGPC